MNDLNYTLARFLELKKSKRLLEDELQTINRELAAIEEALLATMESLGLQTLTTKDGETIYVYRQLWASVKNKEADLAAIMREAGLDDILTVNHSRLSAYVRELPQDEEGNPILPEPLQGVVGVYAKTSVRSKKS